MFRRVSARSVSLPMTRQTAREYSRTLSARRSVSNDFGTLCSASLTTRIDAMESPARDVFREAYDMFADALVIPNEWLPKRLQNRKTSGQTPARIFASLRKAEAVESDHARIKTEKECRVRQYADQVRQGAESPDYDTDGQERLIEYAARSFGRLLAKMITFDAPETDAEFLKKLRS